MTADDGEQRFVHGVEGGLVRERGQPLQGDQLQRGQNQGDMVRAGDQPLALGQQGRQGGQRRHREGLGQVRVLAGRPHDKLEDGVVGHSLAGVLGQHTECRCVCACVCEHLIDVCASACAPVCMNI